MIPELQTHSKNHAYHLLFQTKQFYADVKKEVKLTKEAYPDKSEVEIYRMSVASVEWRYKQKDIDDYEGFTLLKNGRVKIDMA